MSEDEGKPTLGADLTSEYEVLTKDGWRTVDDRSSDGWVYNGLLGVNAVPIAHNSLTCTARKIPKPDPIQERAERVEEIIFEELRADDDALVKVTDIGPRFRRIAQRIANGEADLPAIRKETC